MGDTCITMEKDRMNGTLRLRSLTFANLIFKPAIAGTIRCQSYSCNR
jgi:hypothetical protein